MSVLPDFDWARSHEQPYRHAWIPRLFPSTSNDRILKWLEQDIPWKFTKKMFYRQFEFSLKDVSPPADLDFLLADNTLATMAEWLREEFDSPEIEPTDVVAHLLESGHGIGVHNDYRKDGETLRLALQFQPQCDWRGDRVISKSKSGFGLSALPAGTRNRYRVRYYRSFVPCCEQSD